ncbi:MAG: ribonuclease HI [Enterobacterales bacterium]
MTNKIKIFTDGSCINNPGPGGYGAILKYGKYEQLLSAGYKLTTNNRMELMAIISAISYLKYKYEITLITDSKYVYSGVTKWIINWKKLGWKNQNKKRIKNFDLWINLDLLINKHIIIWNWVKGHSGNIYNERCHKLAYIAALNPMFNDI